MARKGKVNKDKDLGFEIISRKDSDSRRVDKNAPVPGFSSPVTTPGGGGVAQYSQPRPRFSDTNEGVAETDVGGMRPIQEQVGMRTPAQQEDTDFSKGRGSHIIA